MSELRYSKEESIKHYHSEHGKAFCDVVGELMWYKRCDVCSTEQCCEVWWKDRSRWTSIRYYGLNLCKDCIKPVLSGSDLKQNEVSRIMEPYYKKTGIENLNIL